ncbi:holo-ACP synthase [Paradesulfitobacterium aromaticivorans]
MFPGVDIIEIERFRQACARRPRLYERLFTARERERLQGKGVQSWAARFAGKEAVFKALGTGLSGLSWHDIEILTENSGEPVVVCSERASVLMHARGGTRMRLSLAHNTSQAVAMAILS